MRRVVVTGFGIVSSLGNNKEEVLDSLINTRSGLKFAEEYAEKGLRSQVAGLINVDLKEHIDRKLLRFMGLGAAFSYISMKEAIEHSGLAEDQIKNDRTGLIVGTGGISNIDVIEAAAILEEKGIRKVGPYRVPRGMASTASANLATAFGIRGINYSISSACATSAHCIGNAMEQIQLGKQDVIFAGGGEDEHWSEAMQFDAMGALSTQYNETPEKASRTYCGKRDGFVISGGGGIVVLEELEHAIARGATIYAEVVGYGATSDGADMVAPSGEGAIRCMKQTLATTDGEVSYINTHGTSTPAGDIVELNAVKEVFGSNIPPLSSTKALTGHALGAAGVHEAIYCLLMQQNNFMVASANIEELDPGAEGMPIVRETRKDVELPLVISNSFGFGGTNACLAFQKWT